MNERESTLERGDVIALIACWLSILAIQFFAVWFD